MSQSVLTSQELPESPSSASTSSSASRSTSIQQTFLERITGLPLMRAGVARVQDVYRATKERHDLIRSALEAGEATVASSLTRAAGILQKTGLSDALQKPLSLAESSACFVLDQVEAKLPIITKTPYEIKLMISDNVDAKRDQIAAVKENTVRLYDGYKSLGTQTIEDARQIGNEKVKQVLDTSVGQKINETLERTLTIADSAVDRFLPERGSASSGVNNTGKQGNGNAGINGHAYSNGSSASSAHIGTYDHAKLLTSKVRRRFSAKSSDVVDSVLHNPAVSGVTEVALQKLSDAHQTAGVVYERFAMFTGKAVGVWYSATLFLLPRQLQDKFAVAVNGLVDKLLTYRHGAAEASS